MNSIESSCLNCENLQYLENITADVIEAARVRDGQEITPFGSNMTGDTIILPGGRNCYPAFWVRDYAMSLETGFMTPEEQKHALLLTAGHQQEGDWKTPSGSFVPNGSIVDHVSPSNKAIFFPGTIDDYENQGGEWGKYPSLDDHFYFIHMAWYYITSIGDISILDQDIKGKKLIDRMELAFTVPPSRENHLVYCDEENRGVSFGFIDTVYNTGELFFCSLLKYQAAIQMAELFELMNNNSLADKYLVIADAIKTAIPKTFEMSDGLFRASTGKSNQPDVWGSAFGVYTNAFDANTQKNICNVLAESCQKGTLAYRGHIRHLRTYDDYSESIIWDSIVDSHKKNTYQNGAYWSTPTGWVTYAIAQVNMDLAARIAHEYIEELCEGDFRKGLQFGSPWECIHPDGDYKQNPVYMTSVACPLIAFRKLWA